jgi:hypothetical protein
VDGSRKERTAAVQGLQRDVRHRCGLREPQARGPVRAPHGL